MIYYRALTRANRLFQILDRLLLDAERWALLMMQPAELLQHFRVIGISIQNSSVGRFGRVVLNACIRKRFRMSRWGHVHLFAARAHALSETKYLLRSTVVGD